MSVTGFNRRRRELEQAEPEQEVIDAAEAGDVEQADPEPKPKNTRKSAAKE